MDNSDLLTTKNQRLNLLKNCSQFLGKIISDDTFRNVLYVANGTRKIFCSDGAKVEEVAKLKKELDELVYEIAKEIKPLYESIQKATINY